MGTAKQVRGFAEVAPFPTPITPNPNGQWVAQIARNMSQVFVEEPKESRPTHIIRDRDTKFTAQFCSILESDGIEFRPIPPLSFRHHADARKSTPNGRNPDARLSPRVSLMRGARSAAASSLCLLGDGRKCHF